MEHKIISADYHRNGVGGEGFYVALVESTGDNPGRYLCIDFSGNLDSQDFDPGRFAVLNVDQIAAGNIGMFPITDPDTADRIPGTGGAAYQGADYWGNELRPLIRDWVRRSTDAWRPAIHRHDA